MKTAHIFIAAITLVSCGRPADLDAIEGQFVKNASSFEILTAMIKEDFDGDGCFSVGTDNIGEYWGYSDEWAHSQDYQSKLHIDQVLDRVGIEPGKYSKYLELFSVTNSERVTFCPPSNYYIMAYRSGLGVSGCLLDIVKGAQPPTAYGKRNNGEDFMEVRLLASGWWMEYKCT